MSDLTPLLATADLSGLADREGVWFATGRGPVFVSRYAPHGNFIRAAVRSRPGVADRDRPGRAGIGRPPPPVRTHQIDASARGDDARPPPRHPPPERRIGRLEHPRRHRPRLAHRPHRAAQHHRPRPGRTSGGLTVGPVPGGRRRGRRPAPAVRPRSPAHHPHRPAERLVTPLRPPRAHWQRARAQGRPDVRRLHQVLVLLRLDPPHPPNSAPAPWPNSTAAKPPANRPQPTNRRTRSRGPHRPSGGRPHPPTAVAVRRRGLSAVSLHPSERSPSCTCGGSSAPMTRWLPNCARSSPCAGAATASSASRPGSTPTPARRGRPATTPRGGAARSACRPTGTASASPPRPPNSTAPSGSCAARPSPY